MANHDVVRFLCALRNYLIGYHDDQCLQLINRGGQDGDPGKDRI
jgi:hypothetical protein